MINCENIRNHNLFFQAGEGKIMPVRVTWGSEDQRLLIVHFEGNRGLSDFHRAVHRSYAMMDEAPHQVNMFIDVHASRSLPAGFIGAIRAMSKKRHRNAGTMVMIGMNGLLRSFVGLFRKLNPHPVGTRMYIVDDYDQAYALLPAQSLLSEDIR